jgi:hypothetical protein
VDSYQNKIKALLAQSNLIANGTKAAEKEKPVQQVA